MERRIYCYSGIKQKINPIQSFAETGMGKNYRKSNNPKTY
jgi:hypothetical protein